MIIADVKNPALPQPYDRLHPTVMRNPAMICEPQINFAIHGLHFSFDCVLVEVLDALTPSLELPLASPIPPPLILWLRPRAENEGGVRSPKLANSS